MTQPSLRKRIKEILKEVQKYGAGLSDKMDSVKALKIILKMVAECIPERPKEHSWVMDSFESQEGWNACLEEIKRRLR